MIALVGSFSIFNQLDAATSRWVGADEVSDLSNFGINPINLGSNYFSPLPLPASLTVPDELTDDNEGILVGYSYSDNTLLNTCPSSPINKVRVNYQLDSTFNSTLAIMGVFILDEQGNPLPGAFTQEPLGSSNYSGASGFGRKIETLTLGTYTFEYTLMNPIDPLLTKIMPLLRIQTDYGGGSEGLENTADITVRSVDFEFAECPEPQKNSESPKNMSKRRIVQKNTAPCAFFTQHMKIGDRDGQLLQSSQEVGVSTTANEVRLLQEHLNLQGFDPGPIDGIYGPLTQAAVGNWQADTQKTIVLEDSIETNNQDTILGPWGIGEATGAFYQSSEVRMNEILGCYDSVVLDNGVWIQ